MVGTKLPAIKSIRNSKVWSNNVPVFGPSFCSNDVSGLLKVTFPSIEVDASWKTNITIMKALLKRFYHRIKGNTGLAAAKIN
jgi:hypothetical protein